MPYITENNRRRFRRAPLAAALAAAAAGSLAPVVHSQDRYDLRLEEVIVTSQRRTESQMDVPITMGSFDADDVLNTGALSLMDMNHFIPGVSVTLGQVTQSAVTIRGVSGSTISSGGSPSVATFYDGAYLPPAATTVSFNDLERVEVLKGPQGTLFGRNAAGGAVNILPNHPVGFNEGFVMAKLGNDGFQRYEVMANWAATDNFFLRFNLLDNQRDGWAENIGGGGDAGEENNTAARLSALWIVNDSTDIQLSYDWDEVDQPAAPGIGVGEYSLTEGDAYPDKFANDAVGGGETRDMQAVGVKLNHEISDNWGMQYLVNYREYETTNFLDDDGTNDPTRYIASGNTEDSDILYTELQFNFNNDFIDAVFGASYSEEDISQEIPVFLTPDSLTREVTNGLNSALGTDFDHLWNPDDWAVISGLLGLGSEQSDDNYAALGDFINLISPGDGDLVFGPSGSYANTGELYDEVTYVEGDFTNWGVYGDVTFHLSEVLHLSLGLRYSEDNKDFSWFTPAGSYATAHPELGISSLGLLEYQPVKLEASDSWNQTTGRAVLSYDISDSVMTFASYSTGYKAGGYDAFSVSTAEIPLEPENVTNYELGIKGDFFDSRFRVELGIYQIEVEDQQRNVLALDDAEDTTPVYRANNGNTENSGVELIMDWVVAESLKLRLVTGYTDTENEFDDFINSSGEVQEGVTSGHSKPQDNYTFSVDWTPYVETGSILVHLDYIFTKNMIELQPNYLEEFAYVDGYGNDRKRLNARVAWASDDDHYEVALWGQNLLDEPYVDSIEGLGINIFSTPVARRIEYPRTYGVDLRYNF